MEELIQMDSVENEKKKSSVEFKILGDDLQALEIRLKPGETVVAEAGTMLMMGPGIEMETTTGVEGGFFDKAVKGITRKLAGESFFVTQYENKNDTDSEVLFAAPYPGKVVPIDLNQFGGEFLCQRDSFICAEKETDVSIALTKKIGSGLFGGEGFILESLKGDGVAFVHAGGTLIEMDLKPGEQVKIDTGCLVGMAPSVDYDIKMQKGIKNILFGGEGLFLATLTGPGKVYIQSLPFSRLADRILKAGYGMGGFNGEKKGLSGIGGELIKDLISGK